MVGTSSGSGAPSARRTVPDNVLTPLVASVTIVTHEVELCQSKPLRPNRTTATVASAIHRTLSFEGVEYTDPRASTGSPKTRGDEASWPLAPCHGSLQSTSAAGISLQPPYTDYSLVAHLKTGYLLHGKIRVLRCRLGFQGV